MPKIYDFEEERHRDLTGIVKAEVPRGHEAVTEEQARRIGHIERRREEARGRIERNRTLFVAAILGATALAVSGFVNKYMGRPNSAPIPVQTERLPMIPPVSNVVLTPGLKPANVLDYHPRVDDR